MSNKSEKYGTYYGTLVEYFYDLSFGDYCDESLEDLVRKIRGCNVHKILFDIIDGDDNYSDTMFFETHRLSSFKELMTIMVNIRPHEFSEETPHHFRVWFD
jgi:hypothetical protein